MKHDLARKLRREQTGPERKLWSALRAHQFDGFKFRRQQPIGPYIADFVCFETKLIIELDGDQHGSDQIIAYDKARTLFLEAEGFRVLRFPNFEVTSNLGLVLETIDRFLHLPDPVGPKDSTKALSPCGRGRT